MEKRVNNNDVGVQTVNPERKNKIEAKSADPAIPGAADRIQEKPGDKLQEMRTGDGRNFVPDDRPGVLRASDSRLIGGEEALHALGIKMNFAMLFAREAFQQFGKRALCAMPAVNEG